MVHADFTLWDLERTFGIQNRWSQTSILGEPVHVEPSERLKKDVAFMENMPSLRAKKKGRAEFVLAPVFREVIENSKGTLILYSGGELDVNKETGLGGRYDFIFDRDTQTYSIHDAVLTIREELDGDVLEGIEPCAVQLFNARKRSREYGKGMDIVYGCVTDAYSFKFLKLEGDTVYVDRKDYHITKLPELLGAFQIIIDFYKKYSY